MFIVKNLQETSAGHLECETLNGEKWGRFTMSCSDEYEIHEDSEWQGIKPCDPAEKTAYEQAEVRTGMLAELIALDVSPRTIEDALLGDEYALNKVREANNKKAELRKGL